MSAPKIKPEQPPRITVLDLVKRLQVSLSVALAKWNEADPAAKDSDLYAALDNSKLSDPKVWEIINLAHLNIDEITAQPQLPAVEPLVIPKPINYIEIIACAHTRKKREREQRKIYDLAHKFEGVTQDFSGDVWVPSKRMNKFAQVLTAAKIEFEIHRPVKNYYHVEVLALYKRFGNILPPQIKHLDGRKGILFTGGGTAIGSPYYEHSAIVPVDQMEYFVKLLTEHKLKYINHGLALQPIGNGI